MKATLALETGRVFVGAAFGAEGETSGEVVFCTALTGYQEILTDPSYQRQIVVMTYPHIGNYGTRKIFDEAARPFAAGFVAKEFSGTASHWGDAGSLSTIEAYMKKYGVTGIEGIDTRALTRHLRDVGCKRGVIATGEVPAKSLVEKAKRTADMSGADLVREVSCPAPYEWEGEPDLRKTEPKRIVVMDFGVKRSILRSLAERGCRVDIVPAGTSAEEILARSPDGIMLSNGPGDPAAVTYAVDTIRRLVAHDEKASKPIPIFGICLGHQLLGLALGGKTYKLKFGHRGANHPVKDLTTGKVEVTTQNHGFAVDIDSMAGKAVELTHVNLNDQTLEGFRHKHLPVFSVQYHPEASPGPHDAHYLFDRFIDLAGKSPRP
jgi:carbamoyl-phosphate synthase small subunit